MRKIISTMMTLIMTIALLPSTIFANSAPVYWENYHNSETLVLDKNSPIEVIQEELIFDFSNQGDRHVDLVNGQITAKYHMKNPTNETQIVKMVFPFIDEPNYVLKNMNKINVMAGENELSTELYFTNNYLSNDVDYHDEYGIENILSAVSDGDNFVDEPCTEYIIDVIPHKDINEEQRVSIELEFTMDHSKTKIIADNINSYGRDENAYSVGSRIYGQDSAEERQIRLWVIGEGIEFEVKAYEDYEKKSETHKFDYKISENKTTSHEVLNELKDELLTQLFRDSNLENEDIVITEHIEDQILKKFIVYLEEQEEMDVVSVFTKDDLRSVLYYECTQVIYYEVEFYPNETIPVTVSYPVSTSMDRRETSEPLYGCTYLFEPANYWADFGTINVVIKPSEEVPYVVESNLEFEKNSSGNYIYSNEGIPSDTLDFSLHENEEVHRLSEVDLFLERELPYLMFFITPIAVLGAMISVVVLLFKWRNKNKNHK